MSVTRRLIGSPDDQPEVELIRSLEAKTREGKIRWFREGSAFIASIPGGLKLNFVITTNIFTSLTEWSLFTVRDKHNNELLHVSGGALVSILSVSGGGIVSATNDLFNLLIASRRDDLNTAIDSVKNL
jgi:hypothetical protein